MCRDRKQAYSQHKGKRYYHGVWGTPEALQKYKRFIAALMENPHLPQPDSKIGDLLVSELAAGFLGYVEPRLDRPILGISREPSAFSSKSTERTPSTSFHRRN